MAAPSACKFFANNIDVGKLSDLTGATIKMALLTSSAAIETHDTATAYTIYSELTNELAQVSNGYSTGGVALSGPTVAATAGNDGFKFSTGNATWSPTVAATIPAWRYGVIYCVGTIWALTSPLLCWFYGDSTPADIPLTATGNTLQITCPATGWFAITRT